MSLQGADVSSWQGAVDWPSFAASGMAFCLIKATEGITYQNPYFAADWAGAAAAGAVRAAYHFARPLSSSPEAEAAYFLAALAAVGGAQPGDLVALDIETGTGNLLPWAQTWLRTVEAALGCKPLLYSRVGFMQPHGLLDASLADYGLWLAAYQATMPPAPAPWTVLALWQYSDAGRVGGVSVPVDTDIFNGDTVEQLRRYGLPVPVKPAWDDAAQYQAIKYVVGGSSPADLVQWIGQYQ